MNIAYQFCMRSDLVVVVLFAHVCNLQRLSFSETVVMLTLFNFSKFFILISVLKDFNIDKKNLVA